MPISLVEAYYEYRYGIFAEQHLSLKERYISKTIKENYDII